jgi:hypothetical protein
MMPVGETTATTSLVIMCCAEPIILRDALLSLAKGRSLLRMTVSIELR